jgi:hypothetical protein
MRTSKPFRFSFIITILVIALSFSPILFSSGAVEVKLISEPFVIAASTPEILGEQDFTLNVDNDYIFGIPEETAVGTSVDSGEYHLEIWSTNRTEIYILDSADYLDYEQNFIGNAPTTYDYMYICDTYLELNFNNPSISPKLIIFSDGRDVNGSFFFSEDLAYANYDPHHVIAKGSDRQTTDYIKIFNVNATISAYLLTDEQYNDYQPDPDENPDNPPSFLDTLLYTEDEIEIEFEFTAPAEENMHLIIWHEEYTGVVTGNIYWAYTYERTFMENYWSLFVVILLMVILVLFFVFQKQVLPPIVWSLTKLKYYCWTIPWRYIGKGLKWIWNGIVKLWKMMRGIELDEKFEEEVSKKPKDDEEPKKE